MPILPLKLGCQMMLDGVLGLEEVALLVDPLDADTTRFDNGEIGLLRANNDEFDGLSSSIASPPFLIPSSGVCRPLALGLLCKNNEGVPGLALCFTVVAEIDSFLYKPPDPTDWESDIESVWAFMIGEVARGVVERERSSKSKSRGVIGRGIPGI